MKTKQKLLILSAFAAITLTGCESIEDYDSRAMTCYDLAREIGKVEARQDKAEDGQIGAIVDSAFGDKDAEYDYEANEIISDDAKETLRYLKNRYRQQGCR